LHHALCKGNDLSRQVTTAQLWETIRTAGLASADDCRKWAKGVTEALGKSIASDPEQLVASLVKFGYLTPYQGNVLYRSLPDPLLLDGVRIEKSLQDTLGDHWYEGRIIPANADKPKLGSGERVWVAAISMETMSSPTVKAWPPSAAWAELHMRVDAPQLDHWRNSGATLQHLYATVEPWSSKSLASELELGPLHIEQSLRMVQDVATGLQSLHAAGLVHGHLSLESILVESNGSFRLRRDPFFPPCSPYHGTHPSLIPHSHSLLAIAAPELALPDSLPSAQSDLYALGCIWYRSITGAWPVEPSVGSSAVSWGALHARIMLQAPRTLPQIAGKCLLHLIAKDPTARFPSAKAFLNALTTDPKVHPIESQEYAKDAPSVAPVVREPVSNYTTKESSSLTAESKHPEQRNPSAPSSTPPKTSKSHNAPDKTPIDKPTAQQPVVKKPVAEEAKSAEAKVPKTPSNPSQANVSTSAGSKSNIPVVPPQKVAEEAVEKIASEIRDKRGRIGQRAPYRPQGPKEPIVNPGDQVSKATSAQPWVENPESSSPSTPVLANETISKVPGAPTPLEIPVSQNTSQETLPTDGEPSANESSGINRETPKKTKRKRPSTQGKKVTGKSKTKGKKGRPFWLLPTLVAGSCVLLLGMLPILRNNAPSVVTIENNANKPKNNNATKPSESNKDLAKVNVPAVDPMSERFEIRADDGKVPWAPPTVGPACNTDLLPMGIETLVYLSPRAWQHQGPIGPMIGWWDSLVSEPRATWWPEIASPTESLEQVTVAWYPGKEEGTARYVVRFAFKEPRKILEVINTSEWSPKSFTGGSEGARGSMWIRSDSGNLDAMLCDDLSASPNTTTKHVTFGPSDLLEGILATKETPFVMRRQLDMLRQASDSSSDLTLLVAPSFLYGDGKEILGTESPKILSLLSQLVDDKVQAFMLRAQWDKDWYLEWRSLGNDLQAATRNAANVKSQIETASNQLEAALVTQPADPYWRAIANRFPQMLRALGKWMRTGAEDGQVVVNAYLPQEAVSNLVIGSWMAAQRDWNSVASAPTATKPTVPAKSIEQWLETPITLRIEQDSLENLLQAIATELRETSNSSSDPLPMAINGTAFQKDGITRNQQVRNFEYTNTPVRQVLTALARRANPVTTVQAPNEKDQKVVWVVLEDPATPSKRKLEFTTRAWTDANKATLPTEFVLPNN
jgi:serine/threonine protein kinase